MCDKDVNDRESTHLVLYKYMGLEQFLNSIDDYLEGKVWFADWKTMNDPMEGVFDASGYYKCLDKIKNEVQNKLDKAKICCLSRRNDSPPMWAHYAKNNTGVCVGFKIDTEKLNEKNIEHRRITYNSNNPRVKGTNDGIIDVLSHKLKDWEYEDEYRLIMRNGETGMQKIGEFKEMKYGFKCNFLDSKYLCWPEKIKNKIIKFTLDDDKWEFNISESEQKNGAEIFKYKCDKNDNITIPSVIRGAAVIIFARLAFCGCTGLVSANIPNTVTIIGDAAFNDCTKLTYVDIPDSVKAIGESVFEGCTALTAINVSEGNPNYASQDGVLFNKEITCLIAFPGGKKGTYKIPDGVTEIDNYAFSGCTKLKAVTIPDSMETIGDEAFYGCTGLTKVTIPGKVKKIGYRAFFECSLDEETCDDLFKRFGKEDFIRITGMDYQIK